MPQPKDAAPLWVKIIMAAALALAGVVIVLHLAGHGPIHHLSPTA